MTTVEVAPPLPPPPATYGRITGRLVSQGPPTVLTLTALYTLSMAGWQYSLNSTFVAGSLTGIGIIVCASAGCFWRYIGAKAIEDSAGDMHSTVQDLNERLDWFKSENKKLAAEVEKFDALVTKWAQEESIHLDMYKKSTGELEITAEAFRARVEELEKFVDIHLQFEAEILKLKAQLLEFKKIAPDVRQRLQVITDAADAIQELPGKLTARITKISTIDDELIGAMNEFRNYVTKFVSCTQAILEIYESTKKERDNFEIKVDDLDARNEQLKALLDRYDQTNEDLGVRAELFKQLVENLMQRGSSKPEEPNKADPRKVRKTKKVVREPV